jgi:hypothetical protein
MLAVCHAKRKSLFLHGRKICHRAMLAPLAQQHRRYALNRTQAGLYYCSLGSCWLSQFAYANSGEFKQSIKEDTT